jgi:ABC-type multidrug transport system ATPase subunit
MSRIRITFENAGKKFNDRYVLRDLNFTISPSDRLAILGSNGSGKSTLMQMIAGYIQPSTGKISFYNDETLMPAENIFSHISIASPYLELIEDYTLAEMIQFHFGLKKISSGLNSKDVIERSGLSAETNKPIRNFSSGMKQRLKLTLAFMSDTSLLLLDEPLTNLDEAGEKWYSKMLNEFSGERTVIVCSNMNEKEYGFCNRKLQLSESKAAVHG